MSKWPAVTNGMSGGITMTIAIGGEKDHRKRRSKKGRDSPESVAELQNRWSGEGNVRQLCPGKIGGKKKGLGNITTGE